MKNVLEGADLLSSMFIVLDIYKLFIRKVFCSSFLSTKFFAQDFCFKKLVIFRQFSAISGDTGVLPVLPGLLLRLERSYGLDRQKVSKVFKGVSSQYEEGKEIGSEKGI